MSNGNAGSDEMKETVRVDTLAVENIIRESEDKFRNTVMQAPVGISILKGRDMVVEMANSTYLSLVDKKEEDFVGKGLYESLPEVQETIEPILLNILDTGEPFYGNEFEITLNRFGQNEQTFFNFVYHPLREVDESVSGIIVVATEVTEQVRAKRALQQREEQFRSLIKQSPIAMAMLKGPEYIVELANDTLLREIWRKELHEVEGKKLLDIFPELKEQQFPELLKNVLETGITYKESEAEAIVNSGDGSKKFYLDFEYAPLYEHDGTVSGTMVTVNDVTEKVEARNIIESSRKRYTSLIETLPVAVFTIDKNGFLDLYNQAAVTLWAREPQLGHDKWCGSHGLYTLDGKHVPHEMCPMALALKENRTIHLEAYVQRPDGEMRHVIAHPQPIHDINGNAIGAMNVLIDITDRKNTEHALKGSEEKFRLLANSMPQLIWTAGPDGILNYFSQSVFDFSGLTEEQIFEKGWIEIVHPDEREKNVALWIESVTTGKDFHYEHRFRRKDGAYRWQLSRAVPQRDEDGNIVMWVGTSTDIHDRRVFSDELGIKVNERTKELQAANESLIRTNDELTQFAYVASHDLQEPLRKIQVFISRILESDFDTLSEQSKGFFGRIENASFRTQKLIQDLLSFSRANIAEKLFEKVDLNEIVEKVEDDLSHIAEEKGAVIKCDKLPVVAAINFQMEQLFTNLLSNALKFASTAQQPEITITTSVITYDNQKYHHVAVHDNGIGFDDEFKERIFMVFQRLHTSQYEGTGIGLAICKKIVENHHGYLEAESSPEKGTFFNIYLPV